jgi:hypothetical protein
VLAAGRDGIMIHAASPSFSPSSSQKYGGSGSLAHLMQISMSLRPSPKTFRFASTAPYYVEVGEKKRRLSKASAELFFTWVRERAGQVKVDDASQREEVLAHHRRAEEFWRELARKANAK